MIGATLNQYRITASIGAGGMGEVFRTRDTRLNRDAAIKVLPKDFVADADRLRRFEQEAKTLAANSIDRQPVYSPDGSEIVFFSKSERQLGNLVGFAKDRSRSPVDL